VFGIIIDLALWDIQKNRNTRWPVSGDARVLEFCYHFAGHIIRKYKTSDAAKR